MLKRDKNEYCGLLRHLLKENMAVKVTALYRVL